VNAATQAAAQAPDDRIGWTQTLKPRLTVNDVTQYSDHPQTYILHVSRGEGYTQFGGFPIPVRTVWPYHKEEYAALGSTPWPDEPQPEMSPRGDVTPKEVDRKVDEESAALEADRDALVNEFFDSQEKGPGREE
jgi:hypothetical protein